MFRARKVFIYLFIFFNFKFNITIDYNIVYNCGVWKLSSY